MTQIQNPADLAAALAQPRAFLFIWANWAIQARSSYSVVAQIIGSWAAEHPDQPAPCYIADVSDQCGEVWDALAAWLAVEGCPAGPIMTSGVGPLLWLRSGNVVHHVLAPIQSGVARLVAASRDAFVDAA